MAIDPPRIVVAEDHPLFRMALKTALQQLDPATHVVETDSVAALQAALESPHQPRLVLLDLGMPGACGFSALLHVRGQYPDLPVIVITSRDDEQTVRRVMGYGAQGFVSKAACMVRLGEAVTQVMDGGTWFPELSADDSMAVQASPFEQKIASLTPQQFRVLGMVGEGLLNKQIAWELHISEATVKAHVTAIFRKLGVRNRTQAVLALQQLTVEDEAGPDSHATAGA